jgi:hypothetical protein
MSAFGFHNIFDHPFLEFPLTKGGVLQLPCGTVPTALVTQEEPAGSPVTEIVIMRPSGAPLIYFVALTGAATQAVFADGSARLNRVSEGPAAVPIRP